MSAALGTSRAGERAARAERAERAVNVALSGRAGRSGLATVSVDELRRAWAAALAGDFRLPGPRLAPARPPDLAPPTAAATRPPSTRPPSTRPASTGLVPPVRAGSWTPVAAEYVLPVVGSVGCCGATALAVAVATAAHATGRSARVVECASLTATGLAGASTAELGTDPLTGWARGTRDDTEPVPGRRLVPAVATGSDRGVVLERGTTVLAGADEVPTPATGEFDLTVIDTAWEPGQLLATPSWLADVVLTRPGVAVTTATGPGLRRLELTLSMLSDPQTWCVAVLGPRRRRWPAPATHEIGPLTAALLNADRLIEVRPDRHLAAAGLTAEPLPRGLVRAATEVLNHLRPAPLEHTTNNNRATQKGTS